MWYAKLDNFLKPQGLDYIDPAACLYLLMDDVETIIVLVIVDDPLFVASSPAAISKMKNALQKRFEVKDLGKAKVIPVLDNGRDEALNTLKLSQGKYSAQVLENFGMVKCRPTGTPLEVGLQLVKVSTSAVLQFRFCSYDINQADL